VNVTVQSLASGSRSGEIDILGCNETQKVEIVQQLGTALNPTTSSEIKVIPNPVSDQQVIISVPRDFKSGRATFLDLNGKILAENRIFSGENQVRVMFPSGMYLLHISGSELNYTTKIVVN
jgi:hypothetical protein